MCALNETNTKRCLFFQISSHAFNTLWRKLCTNKMRFKAVADVEILEGEFVNPRELREQNLQTG